MLVVKKNQLLICYMSTLNACLYFWAPQKQLPVPTKLKLFIFFSNYII